MVHSENQKISPWLVIIVLICLTAILILTIILMKSGGPDQTNPFALDLSDYGKIDSTMIHYQRVTSINITRSKLHGIAVDHLDNFYICADSAVLKFNPDGKELLSFALPNSARTLAVGGDGTVFVAFANTVHQYGPEGLWLKEFLTLDDNSLITAIALDENDIFLADARQKTVWRFGLNGRFLQQIDGGDSEQGRTGFVIPSPFFDLALDPTHHLWVANPGRHLLEQYNTSGSLITSWGKTSADVQGFCGCCNPVHLALLPDGKFVTSEKGLVRVKVHSQNGQFESLVCDPKLFLPNSILDLATDSQGRILVLDSDQSAVHIFTLNENN